MNKDFILTIILLLISVCLFSQQKTNKGDYIENPQELESLPKENRSFFDVVYKFRSRLRKKENRAQLLGWTDRKIYKLSDTIKLIVESNRTFDAWPPFDLQLSQCTKGATAMNTEHDNGKVYTYYLINC